MLCCCHSSSSIELSSSCDDGHYCAYCRPNDGEQWVEFNDSSVYPNPNHVITKDAYVLFFRRVSDAPRTLESLRARDDRCREDSSWMQELEQAPERGGAAGGGHA